VDALLQALHEVLRALPRDDARVEQPT
jgi:hypothetical protein